MNREKGKEKTSINVKKRQSVKDQGERDPERSTLCVGWDGGGAPQKDTGGHPWAPLWSPGML